MTTRPERLGLPEDQERIVELTQAFRDLAKDEIDIRLSELYRSVQGDVSLMDAHKRVTFQGDHNVLASYQVIDPLRDLLLEDNPTGMLEIKIAPPSPKFGMTVRNPQTGAWIMIGALVRPYACPQVPSDRERTEIQRRALEYGEELKDDKSVVPDFYNAKKLIGAIKQIAFFNNALQV